jgi:hypothetical protein
MSGISAFSPWNLTQARTINGSTNISVKALKDHESCENDSVCINDIKIEEFGRRVRFQVIRPGAARVFSLKIKLRGLIFAFL